MGFACAVGFGSSLGSSTVTDGGVGGVALTEGFCTSGGLAMGVFGSGEGGEVVTEVELGSAATGPSTLSSGLSRELSAVTCPDRSCTAALSSTISLSLASLAWIKASACCSERADGAEEGAGAAEVAAVVAGLATADSARCA